MGALTPAQLVGKKRTAPTSHPGMLITESRTYHAPANAEAAKGTWP